MAGGVSRGDIWMCRFARPDKRRPVLVLSRQKALDLLHTATVAPITSTLRGLPSELRLGVAHGLKRESVASFDHIMTVPKSELRRYVGHVDEKAMRDACEAAAIALGCR